MSFPNLPKRLGERPGSTGIGAKGYRAALKGCKPAEVACIGITNQRETSLL